MWGIGLSLAGTTGYAINLGTGNGAVLSRDGYVLTSDRQLTDDSFGRSLLSGITQVTLRQKKRNWHSSLVCDSEISVLGCLG
jgi:hypothetical protein